MKTIYQHITDPPSFRDEDIADVSVVATGSPIGRVIFKEWSPMAVFTDKSEHSIRDCVFTGGSCAVKVEV